MSEPLPPCPLCGGQADIELDPNERGAMNWAIVCMHCFARGPIVRNQWEAPDAWRRLARAVALDRVAALEAELERLREAGEGTVADMQRVMAAVKVLEDHITEAVDVLETGSYAPGVASLILVNAQDEFAQALNPHRFEY